MAAPAYPTRPDQATRLSATTLADHWVTALTGTSYVAMTRRETRAMLIRLACRLLIAFRSAPADLVAARDVGAALVEAHFTGPASLEETLRVCGRLLPGDAGATTAQVAALQGALAAGYATALQERTRLEQERISAAAFAARIAADTARWRSDSRFEAVFTAAALGVVMIDLDGTLVEVNPAVETMFGFGAEEIVGRSVYTFGRPDDDPGPWLRVRDMLVGSVDHVTMERRFCHHDGPHVRVNVVLSLVRDPTGAPRYVVGLLEDISERHRLENRLRHQAEHDPLTGLPNRTVFFERLDAALDGTDRVGVCYLDLDGFKAVNDTLGHDVGDDLLRTVAGRLDHELGGDGHLVARMGGDEFVVLAVGTDHDELQRIAQRALQVVRDPVRLAGHCIPISAGVAVVERGDGGPGGAATLMKAADTTLHWAKQDGRNRCAVFDDTRHRQDIARFELAARMPEALAAGEFVVEYQPLVRLADGHMTGVEALVRWDLPGGERLGPDRFVPVAEETGLIVALGSWVLAEACSRAAEWAADDLLLSVNIAARQVREPGVVADVARILDETGWPADRLQLELTESEFVGSAAESLETLRALADMGVRIAIDDFGTGYSNLAYLRRLPVHALKLAGSFVTGQNGNGADAVDVEVSALLIRLAHVLGLSVIAESVETTAQLDQLRALGCDTGQGWLFAPSVPADKIRELLRDGFETGGRHRR